MNFQRFQNMAWKDLYSRSVHELMDSKSFSLRDVDVSFEAVNTETFLKTPIGGNGTNKQTLNIKIKISHESGCEEIKKELIELPVLSSEGFLIENVKYTLISTFQLASGWYIKNDSDHGLKLTLQRGSIELVTITQGSKGLVATVGATRQKMPLFDFVRAVAGAPTLTEEDILEELQDCRHVVDAYYTWKNSSNEVPRSLNDVSAQVYAALSGRQRDAEYGDAIMLLQDYLRDNKMRMGAERVPRFKKFTGFTRAIGCTLAEPVQVGDSIFSAGEVLTSYALRKMDSADSLKQITVIKDDIYYTLKKLDIDSGLTYDELCCALRVYDQVLSGIGKCDDPDEQYNRILYTVRDAFEGYIEEALNALSRELTNCILRADVRLGIDYICSKAELPACVPFSVTADKIKSGNSAFQQLDETNSLSDFEQGFRITSSAKHVTKSARDIHASEFGRVCPYTTSESKQVGLNRTLSVLCGVDSFGFLTTPVRTFSKGHLSEDTVNISALEELAYVIAPADIDLKALWAENSDNPGCVVADCRVAGQIGTARLADITHQEVSGVQSIGPLVATVPSANRNSGKRLVMTVSAQRQALPTWKRERPLVTTGIDAICEIGVTTAGSFISKYLDSRGIIDADVSDDIRLYLGSVRDIENSIEVTLLFTYNGREYMPTYTLGGARSTVNGSLKYERLATPKHSDEKGQYYASGDVVFHQNDIDTVEAKFNKDTICMDTVEIPAGCAANHSPALGANVNVMFKSMDGYSYEDSIVVNEDFLLRYGLAVVKTKKVSFTLPKKASVGRGSKLDLDIPQLDPVGYPIKGFYVQTGQEILSVKTVSEDGTEKIGARYLGVGENGFVLSHKTYTKNGETIVDIHLGDILPLDVGDKIEGLHGNKGVIGRIVPAQEMPFTEDGEIPDMIFNPLGVLARLNMGQMIEFTKGAIAEETGEIQIMEPFSKESIQDISIHASELGLVEKKIYDGRTGLPYSRKAMIGNMYILRLMHTSTSKYNATGNCASNISKRTLQPMRCQGGGQRISELCSWCLVSYNATETLNSLFTIQSDSLADKRSLDKAIQQHSSTDISYESNNIDYLKAYFFMLGANISVALDGCTRMELLTDAFMREMADGHICRVEELSNNASTAKGILHDPRVFPLSKDELKNREQFGFLPFNCEMVMPLYLNSSSVPNLFACIQYDVKKHAVGYVDKDVRLMSEQMFDALVSGDSQIVDWAEVVVDDSHRGHIQENYGVPLPDVFTVPVIQSTSGRSVTQENSGERIVTGIRAVISLFKTYDVMSTLCAPAVLCDADKVANVLLFSRSYQLSDFIVTGMLVPPVGYRPISEDDRESSNPIDTILAEIIKCVKSLLPRNLTEDQRGNKETNLYLTLKTNLLVHDKKNTSTPSIAQQLSDHQSGVSVMRDTLLAKRVAYSGRSVISIAPDLELGECGVPIPMLATVFEDHIAAEITRSDPGTNYILKHVGILNNDKSARFIKKATRYLAVNNLRGFKVCCMSHISNTPDEFFKKISSECLQGKPPITTVYQLFEKCFTQLKEILEKLLEEHPVLLNREPSLHKFSIQGFKAKPVESYAIQLHPASCHGFNADYDGDQMAVIAPMTVNSRREIREKMLSSKNLIDPKDGSCIVAFNQDIILGLYYATIHKDNVLQYCPEEVAGFYRLPDYKGYAGVQGKSAGVAQEVFDDITTGLIGVHDTIICTYKGNRYIGEAGRFVINALLPNGMGFTTAVMGSEQICGEYAKARFCSLYIDSNFVLTKKTIKAIEDVVIAYFVSNNLGEDEFYDNLGSALNRLMYFGFKFADISGITLSLHDFVKLPIKSLAEKEMQQARSVSATIDDWFNLGCCDEQQRDSSHIDVWSDVSNSLKKRVTRGMKGSEMFDRMSNIFMIVDSGARGDVAQLLTMSGLIGVVTNSSGKGIPSPIQTAYIDGLNAASFFQNAPTARRQVVSAQLTTADSGTLTRSYIYLNEHQRIRNSDERCNATSLWIDVDYEVQIKEDRSELTLVTDVTELDSIDFGQFDGLDLMLWDTEAAKQYYIQLLATAVKMSGSTALTDEFLAQVPKLKMSYLVCKNSDGEYVPIIPEIKMSPTSRSQLLYRVFDASADSWLTSTIVRTAFDFLGEAPDELGDDFVIGEDTISCLEMNMVLKVPIFSIIGCKSINGICRCCYGLKYDTFTFPDFGECIGYQSVQAIGNPITQLILDSHKVEFTGGPTAASRLTDILNSQFKAVEVDPDNVFSAPFATKDNLTVRFNTSGDQRAIALQNGDETVQEIPYNNVLDIRVVEGQTVNTGDRILDFKTNLEQWASLVDFIEVQKYIWGELCSCFDSEFIYARHFELFARSITEFGVAESTELSKGIVKGEIYLTTKLDMAGIKYEPISVGIDKAITYADKVVAGIAQKYLRSRLSRSVVVGATDNPASNVGKFLIGNLATARHPVFAKSVIGQIGRTSVSDTMLEIDEDEDENQVADPYINEDYGIIKVESAVGMFNFDDEGFEEADIAADDLDVSDAEGSVLEDADTTDVFS